MSRYQEALEGLRQAERDCIAELFFECCEGDPHCTDAEGNWLTKEQVYEKLKRGDLT